MSAGRAELQLPCQLWDTCARLAPSDHKKMTGRTADGDDVHLSIHRKSDHSVHFLFQGDCGVFAKQKGNLFWKMQISAIVDIDEQKRQPEEDSHGARVTVDRPRDNSCKTRSRDMPSFDKKPCIICASGKAMGASLMRVHVRKAHGMSWTEYLAKIKTHSGDTYAGTTSVIVKTENHTESEPCQRSKRLRGDGEKEETALVAFSSSRQEAIRDKHAGEHGECEEPSETRLSSAALHVLTEQHPSPQVNVKLENEMVAHGFKGNKDLPTFETACPILSELQTKAASIHCPILNESKGKLKSDPGESADADPHDPSELEHLSKDLSHKQTAKKIKTRTNNMMKPSSNDFSKKQTVKKIKGAKSNKKTYDCPLCCQKFKQIRYVHPHLYSKHPDDSSLKEAVAKVDQERLSLSKQALPSRLKCPLCEVKVTNLYMTNHLKQFHHLHPDLDNIIKSCQEVKDRQLISDGGKSDWSCSCGRPFQSKVALRWHQKHKCLLNKDRTRVYHCGICSYCTPHEDHYNSHKEKHQQENTQFTCEMCGKHYSSRASYNVHKRRSHNVVMLRPLPVKTCDVCSKCFDTKHGLQVHMLKHTGVRCHVCDECGKSFKTKTHMTSHQKHVHLGQHAYVCEKCGHGVSKLQYLQKHVCGHVRSYKPRGEKKPGSSLSMKAKRTPSNSKQASHKSVSMPPSGNPTNVNSLLLSDLNINSRKDQIKVIRIIPESPTNTMEVTINEPYGLSVQVSEPGNLAHASEPVTVLEVSDPCENVITGESLQEFPSTLPSSRCEVPAIGQEISLETEDDFTQISAQGAGNQQYAEEEHTGVIKQEMGLETKSEFSQDLLSIQDIATQKCSTENHTPVESMESPHKNTLHIIPNGQGGYLVPDMGFVIGGNIVIVEH